MYQSRFSGEKEWKGYFSRDCLTQLWRLAGPQSVGQADRLETQVAFDAAVVRQNSFLFEEPQFVLFWPFNQLDEAHPHY